MQAPAVTMAAQTENGQKLAAVGCVLENGFAPIPARHDVVVAPGQLDA